MQVPRVRINVRRSMLIVLGIALLLGAFVAIARHREFIRRRGMAEDHEWRTRTHVRAIGTDIRIALVCLRWSFEGRPKRIPHVFNRIVLPPESESLEGFISTNEILVPKSRSTVMSKWWASESAWWIGEAARNCTRAMWHARMKEKYERAAQEPTAPIPPDPAKPFDNDQ